MTKPEILLIGGGGHCNSCIDVIETGGIFKIAGIIGPSGSNFPQSILGYKTIGSDEDLENLRKEYNYALVTVGQIRSPEIRQSLFSRLKDLKFKLPSILSPLAHVSKYTVIGDGTIVMHQAIVNAGAIIGKNCILNTKCLVEHDVQVGDHTHISTASVVNGDCLIGSRCFIGSNATIVNGINLLDGAFVKAGALICKNQKVISKK